MSWEAFEDNSSSCAIDALTIVSKRISSDFIFFNEVDEESENTANSIMEGEISYSELEKGVKLPVLWNALVIVARKLSLGKLFLSDDPDFSTLPVHVSRFIGAFLCTFELIFEENHKSIEHLSWILLEIFAANDHSKRDYVIQILKEYKDWFPYSYMFSRKVGRYPKPSFSTFSQYFLTQNRVKQGDFEDSRVSEKNSDEIDYEDDDTYGDSFAQEHFPNILTPSIAPPQPFPDELQSEPVESSVSSLPAVDNSISSNQEYILKSYYDYSSNWNNNNVIDEDEDSDRDSSSHYPVKPTRRRVTRMKVNAKRNKPRKVNPFNAVTDSIDADDNAVRSFDSSRAIPAVRTVSFAVDSEVNSSREENHFAIPALTPPVLEQSRAINYTEVPTSTRPFSAPESSKRKDESDIDLSDSERILPTRTPSEQRFESTEIRASRYQNPVPVPRKEDPVVHHSWSSTTSRSTDGHFVVGDETVLHRKGDLVHYSDKPINRKNEARDSFRHDYSRPPFVDYDRNHDMRSSEESKPSGPLISSPAPKIYHSNMKFDLSPPRRSQELPRSAERKRNPEKQISNSLKERVKRLRQSKEEPLKDQSKTEKENEKENEDHSKEEAPNKAKEVNPLFTPVNRQLLPTRVLREKVLPPASTAPKLMTEVVELQQTELSPSFHVTTPIPPHSYDHRSYHQDDPFSDDYASHDEEDLFRNSRQRERNFYESRQSVEIVNLSQSLTGPSYLQQPFQELPTNLTLPPLSELAQESGIIFEGFLNKKSSSVFGQWQRRYFVLRESLTNFCELEIYYGATESLWGMIPLRLKYSYPIFHISQVDTHGKVQAKGREFIVQFSAPSTPRRTFSFRNLLPFSSRTSSNEVLENPSSDPEVMSDTSSVDGEDRGKRSNKPMLLQADDAETRLIWVTVLNKALKAAQLEMIE